MQTRAPSHDVLNGEQPGLAMLATELGQAELLGDLPPESLRALAETALPRRFAPGDAIIVEGDGVTPVRAGTVDPSVKRDGANGYYITPLVDVLTKHANRLKKIAAMGGSPFDGTAMVMVETGTGATATVAMGTGAMAGTATAATAVGAMVATATSVATSGATSEETAGSSNSAVAPPPPRRARWPTNSG